MLFSIVVVLVYIPTNSVKVVSVHHIHANIDYFLILDIVAGVRWYCIVVLIYISLIISDGELFFFLRWSLALSPRLECSGLTSDDPPASASQNAGDYRCEPPCLALNLIFYFIYFIIYLFILRQSFSLVAQVGV